MPAPDPPQGVLLNLAAEGLIPVLGGCAGALAGGPEGGIAGVAVGQVVEKAINFFGARIVQKWYDWLRGQPVEVREAAFGELAALSPQEAKQQAEDAIDRLAPHASPEDKSVALEYLAAIPRSLDKALPLELVGSKRELPPTVTFLEQPLDLLPLLPADAPPYAVPSDLPGTPYRLEQVLGSGGFGTVYKASAATLQHLPLAIKFCLDPNLTAALHQERSLLERLLKAGNEPGAHRVVRLYGYDLDHRTPYLVYEFVSGGDLLRHVARLRRQKGRPLDAAEVRALIVQVVEGLAFAHRHGLVHRDLKPANILVEGETLKLADFGLGSVVAAQVARMSQLGGSTVNHLTAAQQLSLFRGAGTPLYMSPEQRRGAPADPRHDLYSLGVMWYQLLVGDTRRELHPGWAKELAVKFQVPREQIDLIEGCVGWFEERPRDAGELLQLLQSDEGKSAVTSVRPREQSPLPAGTNVVAGSQEQGYRRERLLSLLRQVQNVHLAGVRRHQPARRVLNATLLALLTLGSIFLLFYLFNWLVREFSLMFTVAILLVGILFGGALLAIAVFLRTVQNRKGPLGARLEGELNGLIDQLAAEFPEEVRAWGGPGVLREPAVVNDIVERLSADRVIPSSGQVGATLRQSLLSSQIQRLADAHAVAARRERRSLLPAVVLGLVLGLVFGLVTGRLTHDNADSSMVDVPTVLSVRI